MRKDDITKYALKNPSTVRESETIKLAVVRCLSNLTMRKR